MAAGTVGYAAWKSALDLQTTMRPPAGISVPAGNVYVIPVKDQPAMGAGAPAVLWSSRYSNSSAWRGWYMSSPMRTSALAAGDAARTTSAATAAARMVAPCAANEPTPRASPERQLMRHPPYVPGAGSPARRRRALSEEMRL